MIRLIKDVVYTTEQNGLFVDKTMKSGAFACSTKAEEEKLVKRGFAEFVNEAAAPGATEAKPKKSKK